MPPIYNYMYLHVIHNSLYNRYNIVRKDHITTSNDLNNIMLLLLNNKSHLTSFDFSKHFGGAY